jgi:hypothetical protein
VAHRRWRNGKRAARGTRWVTDQGINGGGGARCGRRLGTERREGEQEEVQWRMAELSLYIGAEGEGGDIKAEEWPTLMGMKRLTLNWNFTLSIEGGGRGNGRGMRCGARGSGSMAGKAGAAQGGG